MTVDHRELRRIARPVLAGGATAVLANSLLFSLGSNWKVFVSAIVVTTIFAIPASIFIALPTILVAVRFGVNKRVAVVIGSAAAGFLGAMSMLAFGLLDPLVLYGRVPEAILSAAEKSAAPGIAGLLGGLVIAALLPPSERMPQRDVGLRARQTE